MSRKKKSKKPKTGDGNGTAETMTPQPEDYNQRSPERTELLTRLKNLLKDVDITPTFWAGCQIGDTKKLEALVRVAAENPACVSSCDYASYVLPLMCKSPDFQAYSNALYGP